MTPTIKLALVSLAIACLGLAACAGSSSVKASADVYATASGTVKAINFSSGDSVAKGDVLCVIG